MQPSRSSSSARRSAEAAAAAPLPWAAAAAWAWAARAGLRGAGGVSPAHRRGAAAAGAAREGRRVERGYADFAPAVLAPAAAMVLAGPGGRRAGDGGRTLWWSACAVWECGSWGLCGFESLRV